MASEETSGSNQQSTWIRPDHQERRDAAFAAMPTLSDEERQVMKECERDSFYQRALPLSLGAMVGAHMLVRSGKWAPHPRFGSVPKAIIFGSIGYFAGKIAYLRECQNKILEKIPNSELAAAIRKARGKQVVETPNATWGDGSSSSQTPRGSPNYKDEYTALEGLDDRHRPSVDRDVKTPASPEEKRSVTYEDLRQRNRKEYEDHIAKRDPRAPGSPSYNDVPLMPQKPKPETKTESLDSFSEPPPPPQKRTNIWGDPID